MATKQWGLHEKKHYFGNQGPTADSWLLFDGTETNCFYWNIKTAQREISLTLHGTNWQSTAGIVSFLKGKKKATQPIYPQPVPQEEQRKEESDSKKRAERSIKVFNPIMDGCLSYSVHNIMCTHTQQSVLTHLLHILCVSLNLHQPLYGDRQYIPPLHSGLILAFITWMRLHHLHCRFQKQTKKIRHTNMIAEDDPFDISVVKWFTAEKRLELTRAQGQQYTEQKTAGDLQRLQNSCMQMTATNISPPDRPGLAAGKRPISSVRGRFSTVSSVNRIFRLTLGT